MTGMEKTRNVMMAGQKDNWVFNSWLSVVMKTAQNQDNQIQWSKIENIMLSLRPPPGRLLLQDVQLQAR
jgi:hypothetical protein